MQTFASLTKTELRRLATRMEHAYGRTGEVYGWHAQTGMYDELLDLNSEVRGELHAR